MRNYIIADNQELTAYALQSLLKRDEGSAIFRAVDKSGLTELLKEHEDAVVFLDYTLFDFADEDQLLIVAERFSLSEWILISDELTPQFVRRVVYSSHQFSLVFKDGPMSEIREALQAVSRHTRYLSQRALPQPAGIGNHYFPTAGRREARYSDVNGNRNHQSHRPG